MVLRNCPSHFLPDRPEQSDRLACLLQTAYDASPKDATGREV
jgi:hypothetical protein